MTRQVDDQERPQFLSLRQHALPRFERCLFWFAVAIAVFHVYANTFGVLPELTLSALHWGGLAFVCAFSYPFSRRLDQSHPRVSLVVDGLFALAAVAVSIYVILSLDSVYERGVHLVTRDWVFAIIAIVLVLELARRAAGWFIPVLTMVGLSYLVLWGSEIGGMFHFPGLTYETALFRSYFETSGMFGDIARISATYVFMFVLFGAFLIRSGAGDFVVDLAQAVAGRVTGGPGLVAVMASALTGTVSGSAVANTVSTGVITIPLMKRAGFSSPFAGGVEAAASTGGQVMPPIMGAGAFIMASYTQLPYTQIVAVSILPALLYFLTVGFWVRIEAKRLGLKPSEAEVASVRQVLARGGMTFLLPIVALIILLMLGFTPTFAAAGGIVTVIASSWLGPRKMKAQEIAEALALGVRNAISTAMLLVAVGLIVMVVSATGLGNTISLLMTDWAGGSLLVAIILVALASLVLGMGLPVTASYIVLGTLSAPALFELLATSQVLDLLQAGQLGEEARAMFLLALPDSAALLGQPMSSVEARELFGALPGEMRSLVFDSSLAAPTLAVTLLTAHLIVFWLSQDSNVTPPVCLAAFAAAAIAEARPMKTGFAAWRIAKGIYVIPLLLAFTPLISSNWWAAIAVFIFSALGLYGLTASLSGYSERVLAVPARVLTAGLSICLLWPMGFVLNVVLAIGLVLILFVPLPHRHFKNA